MINLREICKTHGLEPTELARRLWPTNKHPSHSMWRHQSQGLELTESQIALISDITGLSFEELNKDAWKSLDPIKHILRLEKQGYIIELNTLDWATRLFDKKSKVHDLAFSAKNMAISDYLAKIDALILTIENN